MEKIFVKYEINNPKSQYQPLDEISGTFWIENRDEKDKKLKIVEIRVVACFYKLSSTTKYSTWEPRINVLTKFPIDKGKEIRSGEILKYNFKIQLPKKWKPKTRKTNKDWHLTLGFFQKTGLIATNGADRQTGNFIIPVEHSLNNINFFQSFQKHRA